MHRYTLSILFTGIILGIVGFTPAWAQTAPAETPAAEAEPAPPPPPAHVIKLEPSSQPIHIRVLFEQNPAKEAVVAWTTTAAGESHRLYIDTEPRQGNLEAYATNLPSTHSQAYTLRDIEAEAGMAAHTHNVHLKDLKPATRYYVTVVSDGNASQEYYFITASDDDRTVRLLGVGDSRTPAKGRTDPDNERRQVNALMARLLEKHPDIVAMSHGGDYTNRAFWAELYWWLKDHSEMTTTRDNRLLPIIPVRGNHDRDIGFEEMFWWPQRRGNFYYTTHLNSQVAIVTLNTEISRAGNQRNWLENTLKELRPAKRWIMTQYHRPAYPSVRAFSTGAAQRDAWVPLFEQYQIELSYESHDHALKRTHPIYEGKTNEERGIIYFGDGGGGVPQRNPQADRAYLAVTGRHHHAHMLEFTADRLTVTAVDIEDKEVDRFVLTQDRRDRVE